MTNANTRIPQYIIVIIRVEAVVGLNKNSGQTELTKRLRFGAAQRSVYFYVSLLSNMTVMTMKQVMTRAMDVERLPLTGFVFFPPCREAAAQTVRMRSLASGMGRAEECTKVAAWGQRALQTWRNIWKKCEWLDARARAQTKTILGQRPCYDGAQRLALLFRETYIRVQKTARDKHIAWRQRLQSSEKHAYQWLRQQVPATMKSPDGRVTANIDEQLCAIYDVWKPYINKFQNHTADGDALMNFFGEHMKSHSMHVDDITPEALVKFASTLNPSSAGLDNWRPESMRALALWHPGMFSSLATIYNHIEKHGQWPQSLVTGYVALIPKESSTPESGPGTLRPISR